MIEKFSKEELSEIIKELKDSGYVVDNTTKACALDKAKKAAGINIYVCEDIKKPLYALTDYLTNNVTIKEPKKGGSPRTYKNFHIPDKLADEYVDVLTKILTVTKPYIERRYMK